MTKQTSQGVVPLFRWVEDWRTITTPCSYSMRKSLRGTRMPGVKQQGNGSKHWRRSLFYQPLVDSFRWLQSNSNRRRPMSIARAISFVAFCFSRSTFSSQTCVSRALLIDRFPKRLVYDYLCFSSCHSRHFSEQIGTHWLCWTLHAPFIQQIPRDVHHPRRTTVAHSHAERFSCRWTVGCRHRKQGIFFSTISHPILESRMRWSCAWMNVHTNEVDPIHLGVLIAVLKRRHILSGRNVGTHQGRDEYWNRERLRRADERRR